MTDNLESRLENWGREYGGRDKSIGWPSCNILAILIAHKGFIPDSRGYVPIPIKTAADEIEALVRNMESGDLYKPGRVLRCEYFMLHSAIESKLQNLRRVGLTMSKAGYYIYLGQGKAFIAGALARVPSNPISLSARTN